MKASTIFFLLCALIAVVAISASSFKQMAHLRSSTTGAKAFVVSFQRCKGSSTWTLHGLWPTAMFCTKEPFSEQAIAPLRAEMEEMWHSCPEFNKGNVEFWSHEWEKHGTCAQVNGKNATQLVYFSTGLDLLEKHASRCSPTLTGECRLNLDKDLNVL